MREKRLTKVKMKAIDPQKCLGPTRALIRAWALEMHSLSSYVNGMSKLSFKKIQILHSPPMNSLSTVTSSGLDNNFETMWCSPWFCFRRCDHQSVLLIWNLWSVYLPPLNPLKHRHPMSRIALSHLKICDKSIQQQSWLCNFVVSWIFIIFF